MLVQALQALNTFIQESTGLFTNLKHVLRLLLGNQQGGPLPQLKVVPHQSSLYRTLSGIIVHSVSVILNKSDVNLLLPFLNMLNNPTAIEVSSGLFYIHKPGHGVQFLQLSFWQHRSY